MTFPRLPFVLALGAAAAQPALAQAQEPAAWIGATDCRLAAVRPAPAQAPEWKGACKDGYADGKGVLEWKNKEGKSYRLSGNFAAGQAQADAELSYPNGALYKGTFSNNIPNGKGYIRYANGDQYEGDIRMGQRDGLGEMLYVNGDDYKGQWHHGERDGIGQVTYALGGSYEGEFRNGKRSGHGKLVYAGPPGRSVATVNGRDPNRQEVAHAKESYTVKENEAQTGTNLRRDVALSVPVPPAVGYDSLTPAQRAVVDDMYPALAPGDEPPYPLHGPAEFYKTIASVASITRQRGEISVYVTVGKDGKAQGVRAIGLDDPQARKAVATAAALIAYKPARCAGEPCEMVYPFRLALTLD